MNANSELLLTRAKWNFVDSAWYNQTYGEEGGQEHYSATGAERCRSPNPLFDEKWYRRRYADVLAGIEAGTFKSGFDHYKTVGYHSYSPNPLFEENFYRHINHDLFGLDRRVALRDYANGFDHYLTTGEREGRAAGPFFDYRVWLTFAENAPDFNLANQTFLEVYLRRESSDQHASSVRTSLYFDGVWYLARYPAVRDAIDQREFGSELAHYTVCARSGEFDPSELFSEEDYRAIHQDVYPSVAAGHYFSCFEHFLKHGIMERRSPKRGVDLNKIEVEHPMQTVLGALYNRDAYAYLAWNLLKQERRPDLKVNTLDGEDENWSRMLFINKAACVARSYSRIPLDLSPSEKSPRLSVIIVAYNRFELTMNTLSCLSANREDMQVILVDSGSTDETINLKRYVRGIRIIRFSSNIGYLLACNVALSEVMGEYTLLINNDVEFAPNAIENALRRIESSASIGAVGAKIIRSNGLLQEAGCIVWRDGRTTGYLRGRSPSSPEANFVREVDFCSAAFLMVRTDLFTRAGGYDADFAPAYYEDTDLCVRLTCHGYKIVYDPSVVVYHLEYGSGGQELASGLMERSRERFCAKHIEYLRSRFAFEAKLSVQARAVQSERPAILVIEDVVPERHLGSGYVRSNDIICVMNELGYFVTVFPVRRLSPTSVVRCDDFPERVEIMHEYSIEDLPRFLHERAGYYGIVWVGRSHNMKAVLPILAGNSASVPQFSVILDTEAVVSPRLLSVSNEGSGPETKDVDLGLRALKLGRLLDDELNCGRFCRIIVAVNSIDAWLIKSRGHRAVSILGHSLRIHTSSREFRDRRGLLFIGAIHSEDSPNADGLRWFVNKVLPLIRTHVSADVALTVAGYIRPGITLSNLDSVEAVHILGEFDDPADLYSENRVFVAPTRVAAGIPYKVHEAASYGLPVVATSLLCRQLNWVDGDDIIDGGIDEAEYFALRVHDLYTDQQLWERVRRSASERIRVENSPANFKTSLGKILLDARLPRSC